MPPTSSCSRRQPRWDSRPSNNRHARPRRMPEARLTMKFVRACSKMLRPSVTQVKSTLPPIKTILIAKSDLLAELSASSLKRAGVCGTFRKFLASVRGVCGTFRKLTQVCGAFAEVSASTPQYFLRPSRLPQKSKREIRSLYRRTSRFSQWRRRATSGPHLSYPLIYQWFQSPSARRRVVRPYHRSGNAV